MSEIYSAAIHQIRELCDTSKTYLKFILEPLYLKIHLKVSLKISDVSEWCWNSIWTFKIYLVLVWNIFNSFKQYLTDGDYSVLHHHYYMCACMLFELVKSMSSCSWSSAILYIQLSTLLLHAWWQSIPLPGRISMRADWPQVMYKKLNNIQYKL